MIKKKTIRRELLSSEFIEFDGEMGEITTSLEHIKKRAKDVAKKKGYVIVNSKFYVKKARSWGTWDPYYDISADTEETDKEMEIRLKRSESAKKSAEKRKEAKEKRELKELERLKKKYDGKQ